MNKINRINLYLSITLSKLD